MAPVATTPSSIHMDFDVIYTETYPREQVVALEFKVDLHSFIVTTVAGKTSRHSESFKVAEAVGYT